MFKWIDRLVAHHNPLLATHTTHIHPSIMPPPTTSSKNKRSALDMLMAKRQASSTDIAAHKKRASMLATVRKKELKRRDDEQKKKKNKQQDSGTSVSTNNKTNAVGTSAEKRTVRVRGPLMISDANDGFDAPTARLLYSLLSSHYGMDTSPTGLNHADANMLYGPRAGISTLGRLTRAISNRQVLPTKCKDRLDFPPFTLHGTKLREVLVDHARECTHK